MAWLTNWNRRKLITVNGSTAGAQSDYQMKLTVNQGSGTDSAGVVYLGGNVLTTFNDLRFTKSDGTTLLNYWIESITGTTPNQTATVWIKLAPSPDTIPVSPGIYNFYIYYNNISASIGSNGTNTFIQYHGFANATFYEPFTIPYTLPLIFEASGRRIGPTSNIKWELVDSNNDALADGFGFQNLLPQGYVYFRSYTNNANNNYGGYQTTNPVDGQYYRYKIVKASTTSLKGYIDGTQFMSEITTTTTDPIGLGMFIYAGAGDQQWSFVRKYVSPEPTFSTIGIEELSITVPAAIGGTVTSVGDYRIHTFTSSGTFTANKTMNVEVLLVAGGGAGGGTIGGGGGAGGLIYNSSFAVSSQSYPVTVGAGGVPGTNQDGNIAGNGHNGGNSIFSTLTAIGGGGGGVIDAFNGGSGGGGGRNRFKGIGTIGQGNDGGNGGTNDNTAGGGGGAGSVGGTGSVSIAGSGGIGLEYSISGSSVYYAGGGGGGVRSGWTVGTGGNGGGGAGSAGGIGTAGGANTGGGGGGAGYSGTFYAGASGGSGIVIIRYLLSEDITPANITATLMTITPSENPCRIGICTVTVSVTWTNNGGSEGSFVPNITIDGVLYSSPYPLQPLGAGASVIKQFVISNLAVGTRNICPYPN